MPILFAISVLALVALLWAAISAARHIRRTRRRRQRGLGVAAAASIPGRIGLQVHSTGNTKELSIEEVTPYVEAVISRPVTLQPVTAFQEAPVPRMPMIVPEPPYVPAPAYVPKLTYARVSPFVSVANDTSVPVPSPRLAPETPYSPHVEAAQAQRFGFAFAPPASPQNGMGKIEVARPTLPLPSSESLQPVTQPKSEELPGPVVPKKPSMGLRAAMEQRAAAVGSGRVERADWSYFNKDMGDLTDPYEAPRSRSKTASGDSRQ